MPRYVAFLRGVSPLNAKMPALATAFESAGFTDVKTVLSSGNVVFTSPQASEPALEAKAQAAMQAHMGKSFATTIRAVKDLQTMLDADPFKPLPHPAEAKRVVTFLHHLPDSPPSLPIVHDGAHMLALHGRQVLTAYVPSPRGPVFMSLIEKTFGKNVTTRTWETVKKCVVV